MGRMSTIKSLGSITASLLLAVACGSSGSASNASTSSHPTSDTAMHHVALDVQSSRFGEVLVDGQGRALYLFGADTSTSSTCYDACATAWPPLLTEKGATIDAMHMATASLTGTTTRR